MLGNFIEIPRTVYYAAKSRLLQKLRISEKNWMQKIVEIHTIQSCDHCRKIDDMNEVISASLAPYETDDERDIGIARKRIDELENKKTPLLRGEALEARLNKWSA